jgi:putative ABC transport system permease protein
MGTIGHDLRYAVRMLRTSPLFTSIAVVTLALGIGANTAIVSVIDNLFFRPPPFQHVDRLVSIIDTNPEKVPPDVEVPPSPGNVRDWRERARSFDDITMWRNWYYAVRDVGPDAGLPESVRGERVSPPFFRMLGVDAAIGRTFSDEEGVPGRDGVVVLAHRLWLRRFGGDRAIVGRQILIDGQARTVIGILPESFQFYQPDLELWMPLADDAALRDRENHSVLVFARLAPNVSMEQAQRELDGITSQLAREHPDTNTGWGARILPLYPGREVRDIRPALIVLLAASGLVLLIASVNVANLLLGRAIARRHEMVIRTAIGASRWRLIRQMLTESLTLGIAGGAAGVVVARWGVAVLVPLLPRAGTNQGMGVFRPMMPVLDIRVLAFSVSVALLTGIVFGLAPAFQSTRLDSLRLSAASVPRGTASRWLMVAELTLAIVLLAGAALLIKSFWRLQTVNPGFEADHLLTMQLWLPKTKYSEPDHARRVFEQLMPQIARLPGVRGAGAVSFRPFLGMAMTTRVDVQGTTARRPGDDVFVGYDVVTPGYLRLLGQRLVRGRDLADGDTDEAMGAAVVNEAMARQLWPDEDPIGKQIRPGFSRTDVPWAVDAPARWVTIVGVAADIKEFRLNETARPLMYVSYRQFPSSFMYLVVRTEAAPETLAASVQREIHALDPDEPVSNVRTMEQAIAEAAPRWRCS